MMCNKNQRELDLNTQNHDHMTHLIHLKHTVTPINTEIRPQMKLILFKYKYKDMFTILKSLSDEK